MSEDRSAELNKLFRFIIFQCVLSFLAVILYSTASAIPLSIYSNAQLRYDRVYLSDGEGNDNKFHQILDLTVTEKEWNHFRFSLSGDMVEDVDCKRNDENDRLRNINDTWNYTSHGYLYICQVEMYNYGLLNYARLGRQYVNHELTSHIDGLNFSVNTELYDMNIEPFAYIGLPVHLYEYPDYSETKEIGGGAHIYLFKSTKITVEHLYIQDIPEIAGTYGDDEKRDYQETAIAARRPLFNNGYGYASLKMLDFCPKQINTMFSFTFEGLNLDVDASYLYQFNEIDKMSRSTSLYTDLTGKILPHHFITLDLMKGLYKDYLYLSMGTEWRLLGIGEDESEFNHSYNHEYLAVTMDNLLKKGLHLSLQADYWRTMDGHNQDTIISGGGEAGYEKSGAYGIQIGSYYSQYQYDYFINEDEITNVYTIYSRLNYYLKHDLYIKASYELDIYDIYEHQFSVTLGHQI